MVSELDPYSARDGHGSLGLSQQVRFPWGDLGPHPHHFASSREAHDYNAAMCRGCGLRILHLWLNSRDWVRRRTEAVTFVDDRTVRRHVTVDFIMPEYAPSLTMAADVPHFSIAF
jgi:hypothetical protein